MDSVFEFPLLEISVGNMKIGTDTMIYNMCSALDCPANKIGLCPLSNPKECYARKAERLWPQVLPFRRRQEMYWKETPAWVIAKDFASRAWLERGQLRYLRLSESGDFNGQEDVDKMASVAERMRQYDRTLVIYGYTARSDLDFSVMPRNVVMNGSGFMLDNNFVIVDEFTDETRFHCPGDCRICNLCKGNGGKTIQVLKH